MLFYLPSNPPRSRERIGADLWPEASPSRLRGVFHTTLYNLRRALGASGWVRFEGNLYTLDRGGPAGRLYYDVEDFEARLEEAGPSGREEPGRAIALLRGAASLCRGDFLEDLYLGEWAEPVRDELRRKCLEALLELGRLLSLEERHSEAADAYRQAIARDPYSGAAHRGLILCHARLGERARALKHYGELAETLQRELGAPPEAETTDLAEKLRRGEEV